ncbi:MAG: carbonic anhydrase [Pirellulaceae bacterium]
MWTARAEASNWAVGSLRDQARAKSQQTAADSLWIVCTDAVMDRALAQLWETESPLVLRSHGGRVTEDAAPHADVPGAPERGIEYAVEQLRVHDVVVCGHSMCAGLPAELDARRPSPTAADALLGRVRQREAMNERGRRFVIEQLETLEKLPAIAAAVSERRLRVHGVFYLIESGLFTLYERESGAFLPLHPMYDARDVQRAAAL